MSEPPSPPKNAAAETEAGSVSVDVDAGTFAVDSEVAQETRLPLAPAPSAQRLGPPRPGVRGGPPRPASRPDVPTTAKATPEVAPDSIAPMPIIAVGRPSPEEPEAAPLAPKRIEVSPSPSPRSDFSELDEEVTQPRARAPAESLVTEIAALDVPPTPEPPTPLVPKIADASANGSSAAAGVDEDLLGAEDIEVAPDSEKPPEADTLPDEIVDSIPPSAPASFDVSAEADAAPEEHPSEPPPEVDPEDMELHDLAPTDTSAKQPPPVRIPLPLPLYARGAELAAAIGAQQADTATAKRARYWWDELFGDDFLRTMDRLTEGQVKSEVNFIEESLGVQKGGLILDLACGAGLHSVEMSLRGYNVVGYDLSLAMLARAADEAQDRCQKLNFLHGDMRELGFEDMFDGVYCWSTSFGYFDDEKNQLVAQNIHRALRTGGMLLLDVANRDFVTQRQPSLVWFEGDGCVCMDDMRVDFISSRLRVKRMVIFDDGRTREMDYSIRLYTLHELGRMLHDVGFKVTEVSGHPATPGVFMGADSPRLIVLAEKA